jgi:GTPase SAR1 family protein
LLLCPILHVMGLDVTADMTGDEETSNGVSSRPSVVIVGPNNVGKRSILNRLIGKQERVKSTSLSGATCHGWTIDTKYYTADACIWTLDSDGSNAENITEAVFKNCQALCMVFDLSDATSFEKLQKWVEAADMMNYEVLMCVGNKADRLPTHFGHTEYRRRLQKRGESFSDPHPDFMDFGIDRTEGSGLLSDGDQKEEPEQRRHSCIEWCTEHGIEYIEACAINEVFDQCMSVDGDLQGIPRIIGALSAHMWPGLVMKPAEKHTNVQQVSEENDGDFSSEDGEDYLIEYELLSNASTEPWDGNEEMWTFRGSDAPPLNVVPSTGEYTDPETSGIIFNKEGDSEDYPTDVSPPSGMNSLAESTVIVQHSDGVEEPEASTSSGVVSRTVLPEPLKATEKPKPTNDKEHGAEDLERLMFEMASMRENMQSMSDGQRKEMAAQLAIRMATMFNGDEDEDEDDDEF